MLQWTYNSNAIEGNTLTYKETSFYLLRGLTAKGKSLEEHLEISNHKEAISFLEETLKDRNFKLSEKFIKEIHAILFKGIHHIKIGSPGRQHLMDIQGGTYKKQDNHVLKSDGSIHYYTPALSVPAEMNKLVSWSLKNWKTIHPIELSAKIHYELVRIHPFTDGNGRVARLVMNLVLMFHHYPPAIIKNDEKTDYYNSLERADHGDLRTFIKIISNEVSNTIDSILKIASGVPQQNHKNKHPLYFIRKEKSLTQKELSLRSGVEQATISKIENFSESPHRQTLARLAKALKVDLEKLIHSS